jgi:hypothetical protein
MNRSLFFFPPTSDFPKNSRKPTNKKKALEGVKFCSLQIVQFSNGKAWLDMFFKCYVSCISCTVNREISMRILSLRLWVKRFLSLTPWVLQGFSLSVASAGVSAIFTHFD